MMSTLSWRRGIGAKTMLKIWRIKVRGHGNSIKAYPARPLLQHWLELCHILEDET